MNNLPKGLKRIDKLKNFKEKLVGQVKSMEHFRLDSDFTECVINECILFVKDKDEIDPIELSISVLRGAYDLNESEIEVVKNQVKTAKRNGRLIKNPQFKRVCNKLLFFFGMAAISYVNKQLK